MKSMRLKVIIKRLGLYGFARRILMHGRILRYGLHGVDPRAYISAGTSRNLRSDLILGAYAFLGQECVIQSNVSIGRYSMLAQRASIVGADHRADLPGTPMIFAGRPETPETIIGDDVWIGFGALIMQGVSIGNGSIIGAMAVVTKDVPPYEVWAGVPARKIKDRFSTAEDRSRHEAMLGGPIFVGRLCEEDSEPARNIPA
jgi:acetyltransferase-like isoleucine patch superfamily enzyme